MADRPNNDDLQEYYQGKNRKRESRNKKEGKMDKSVEKIYMQKLDRKR